MENIKLNIEEAMYPLVGTKLDGISRAYKTQELHFDKYPCILSNGTVQYLGKYILSIDSSWRILCNGRLLVGSNDIYKEVEETNMDEYDADIPIYSLRDDKLGDLVFSEVELRVIGLKASDLGDLQIFFDYGYTLEIFPDHTNLGTKDFFWSALSTLQDRELISIKELI